MSAGEEKLFSGNPSIQTAGTTVGTPASVVDVPSQSVCDCFIGSHLLDFILLSLEQHS